MRGHKLTREQIYRIQVGSAITAVDNVGCVRVTKGGRITKVYGAMAAVTATLELNRVRAGTKAVVGTVAATTSGVLMTSLDNTNVLEGDYLAMDVNAIGTLPTGATLTVHVEQ